MLDPTQHLSSEIQPDSEVSWTSLEEIKRPGAYITRETGDLLRVIHTGQGLDAEELIEKHTSSPIEVTCLSTDPFIPITRARIEAANRDIEVKF